jgi:hypothetical protein
MQFGEKKNYVLTTVDILSIIIIDNDMEIQENPKENVMKLKSGFVMKEIAGECVVISTASDLDLKGIITLNSTAKTIWAALESGVETIDGLVAALTSEYDVDEATARKAVEDFIARLKELNFIE